MYYLWLQECHWIVYLIVKKLAGIVVDLRLSSLENFGWVGFLRFSIRVHDEVGYKFMHFERMFGRCGGRCVIIFLGIA